MTKKQRLMRNRIIISLSIFILLMILEKCGLLEWAGRWGQLVFFAVPYLIVGYDILIKAAKNIRNGRVFDENFLMIVATFAAFAIVEYSEALAVMIFYQIGEFFQNYAVGKSRQSIAEMMSIVPEYANLEGEEGIVQVDPEDVEVGNIIVIKPGEKIPLDGAVIEGSSFINTAPLTGEPVPRQVQAGESVISGCINGEGILKVRVEKIFEDSTVSRILELVEEASERKAKLERFITRFAKYYTPVVTLLALALAIIPPLTFSSEGFAPWIQRACVFLIVSCPCALVISVPLGFFGGIGAASKQGILVKGGNLLEAASYVKTLVFDKTGTLTEGKFALRKIIPAPGVDKEEPLGVAAYAESLSSHPIAQSIVQAYKNEIDEKRLSNMSEVPGHGIMAELDGTKICAGNALLMQKEGIDYIPCDEPGTLVYVSRGGDFLGTLLISDRPKEGVREALSELKRIGIRLVMLTGDRKEAAEEVAAQLGVEQVFSELLPQDKVSCMEELLKASTDREKVGFVGDGINDAPVIMRADVGFAMGSMGSDAAIEAADIVLMDDDISKIASSVRISKKTMGIVKQNIVFALGVKVIVLVLGAIGIASMWGAVFADVGVAVIAILNSMRALKTI